MQCTRNPSPSPQLPAPLRCTIPLPSNPHLHTPWDEPNTLVAHLGLPDGDGSADDGAHADGNQVAGKHGVVAAQVVLGDLHSTAEQGSGRESAERTWRGGYAVAACTDSSVRKGDLAHAKPRRAAWRQSAGLLIAAWEPVQLRGSQLQVIRVLRTVNSKSKAGTPTLP